MAVSAKAQDIYTQLSLKLTSYITVKIDISSDGVSISHEQFQCWLKNFRRLRITQCMQLVFNTRPSNEILEEDCIYRCRDKHILCVVYTETEDHFDNKQPHKWDPHIELHGATAHYIMLSKT